jgi:VWFA-related protein
MLRFHNCCFFAGFVCTSIFAAAQATSTEPVTTLHATSKLVLVDVVVTDSKQDPIHHLAASDFTLMEDGHPQAIKAFEEHTADAHVTIPPLPKLPAGKFTNFTTAPANGALNILLLDKLNTPLAAQAEVRNQVLKYLKEAPSGTRIAIFALSTRLALLQGFTSDPDLLRDLVAGKKTLPGSSPLSNGEVSGSNDLMMNSLDAANNDIMGNSPDAATVMATLQQFQAQEVSFQLMLRARYTLDAFNQLARYLSTLPGRKNVIWFSGSFPFNIMPDGESQDPFSAVASSEDEFRETVNLLARNQVAVYPIDARQLMADNAMLNAASSGAGYVKNPTGVDRKYYAALDAEHSTMNTMAEETGGKAFMNTNDLKSAVAKAIEAGANYYTLAYAPTNPNAKGEYRKIEVKLDRSGARLAYRRGYFTDEPVTAKHQDAAQDTQNAATTYSPVRAAMQHGAPTPQQLVFLADVRPANTETEPTPASGNQPDPKTAGPYHRYISTFVVNPKDLDCALTMTGDHFCDIEFLTFVYDSDGALVNMAMNGLKASYSGEHWAAFLKAPLAYRQQISVPVKGNYYLRLGLYDETADHIGALELPVAVVAKVPPAPTQAPASSPSPPPQAPPR